MTQAAVRKVKAEFVRQLREAMKAQKVTSATLAKRLKCSRAHITQALDPTTNTTTLTMVKLADALGLEIHFEIKPL